MFPVVLLQLLKSRSLPKMDLRAAAATGMDSRRPAVRNYEEAILVIIRYSLFGELGCFSWRADGWAKMGKLQSVRHEEQKLQQHYE